LSEVLGRADFVEETQLSGSVGTVDSGTGEVRAMTSITDEPGVVQLDRPEGRKLVDREARRVLDVGVDEFLARHDAGELDLDDPDVLDLVLLIPFAR
jgi:hypothetical protein